MAAADSSPDALIAEYGRTLAAVSAYSHRVAELAAAARALAEADGSPDSLELVRRIDAGDFRWGFHVAQDADAERELLADGRSIAVMEEDGHLVRRDPDGPVTPLD